MTATTPLGGLMDIAPLLRELGALYRVHRAQGVPQGRVELVRIEQHLAKLLQLSEPELNAFLSANRSDALKTLRRVLRWLSERPISAQTPTTDATELPELNALVGLANLRSVVATWESNSKNDNEEFWQGVLEQHAFVLSQLFAYPVVIIRGKAYVGGKRYDNTHGNLVDFLGHVPTSGEAVLIEIKTPQTPLLGPEYRQDVYPPSRDLGGAISQVLQYRESLMQELHALNEGRDVRLIGSEPRCLVIAGTAQSELTNDAKKRSFERFRERLVGVGVVTYDEVFGRVDQLISSLGETQAPSSGNQDSL